MSLTRIFVHPKINSGKKIALDKFASQHVLHALRLKTGDRLLVFNNSPGEFEASIFLIDKNIAVILVGKFIPRKNESSLSIHLAQGISRGEKMDFTIQKAVELGVHSITPLFTEYCNIKLKGERLEKKLQHWQKVAISATEQSGRCFVPKIFPAENLSSWCKNGGSISELNLILDPDTPNRFSNIKSLHSEIFYLSNKSDQINLLNSCIKHENNNHTKLQNPCAATKPSSITILIGPKGGFSEKEIELAKTNNFSQINLGPRILRTETAALTAISIIQSKWGDF